MKLHSTTVSKLVKLAELHAGRRDNDKLIRALQNLDFSVYSRTENSANKNVLVLTEDLVQEINKTKQ